jgi:hypothetical protein
MKINTKQLKQIIKEQIETLSYEEKTISAEEAESAALARDKAEDIETVDDAWAGGSNLVHPVDFEDEAIDDKVSHGQEILTIGVVEGILRELAAQLKTEEKNEGTTLDNMPDDWRQILGNCLGE